MKKHYLIVITFFVFSCKNKQPIKQFITSYYENGMTVSVKSQFKDTLFYELRYRDTIEYSYNLLSKQQNEELKKLVRNLNTEKSVPRFKFCGQEQILIVDTGKLKFYKNNFLNTSNNYKKIYDFINEMSYQNKTAADKIRNFWNIDGFFAPPELYAK